MIQNTTGIGSFISTMCPLTHHISCRVFGETSNHPGDSSPYSPDFASCDFWLLPKLKSHLKGKRFQTIDSRKYDRAADGDLENCVRSQGAYFEGD